MSLTEIAERLRKRLPHSTQRLVAALGWDGALRFMRKHGSHGTCVYVPLKYNPESNIFEGMDNETASRLIEEFGGQDVRFTGPKKMLATERYSHIISDFEMRGFSTDMLSEKYKLPVRTVHWILQSFR